MLEVKEEELKKILPSDGPSIDEVKKYLEKYNDEYIVIKCGGSVLVDQNLFNIFIKDIATLNKLGFIPIVVHGGGKRINNKLNKLGIKSEFIKGLRVTNKETIQVVEEVLIESGNPYKIMEFIVNWARGNTKIYSQELLAFKAKQSADMRKFAESRSARPRVGWLVGRGCAAAAALSPQEALARARRPPRRHVSVTRHGQCGIRVRLMQAATMRQQAGQVFARYFKKRFLRSSQILAASGGSRC